MGVATLGRTLCARLLYTFLSGKWKTRDAP
jgi:hypothetical protein